MGFNAPGMTLAVAGELAADEPVDPHEAPFNPDGTVNAARRFEKGRVYPEFLAWRPSLDRLPVAATRKRAGRVQGGVAIL